MGVINRNEVHYKKPDQLSSTESLHIPLSSSVSLSSVASIPIQIPTRRQKHHRTLVDSSVNLPRNVGRRRQRRMKAVAELSALIEEDEHELFVDEGIPHDSPFTKITDNPDLEYIWDHFTADDETKLAKLLGENPTIEKNRKIATASYANISYHVKLTFKMMRSVYELDKMEIEITDFFTNTPDSAYISSDKSCFQRLLIHGIAQYYCLKSKSYYAENGKRTIKVENPNKYSTFIDKRLYFIVQDNHNKRV